MTIEKYDKMEKIKDLLKEKGEMSGAEIRYHLGLVHYEVVSLLEKLYSEGEINKIPVGKRWIRWSIK